VEGSENEIVISVTVGETGRIEIVTVGHAHQIKTLVLLESNLKT